MPPGNPSKCWRDYLVVLVKALFWKAEFRGQANMKVQFVIARTKTNGQTVAKLHTTARSAASQTWKTFSKTHPAHPVHPGASRCILSPEDFLSSEDCMLSSIYASCKSLVIAL
jgi:hypothetical protein